MANPSVRSSTTNAGTDTAPTGTKPVGTAIGDVLLACVFTGNSAGNSTISAVPSGWAYLDSTNNTNCRMTVYWKLSAGGGETGSYTWTLGTSGSWVVQIVAVRDPGDTVQPFDNEYITSGGPSTSMVSGGFYTTLANDLLIGFYGIKVNTTITPDASMTEVQDQVSGTLATLETSWQSQASIGNVGSRTAVAAASGLFICSLIAIKGPTVAPPSNAPAYRSSAINTGTSAAPIGNLPAGTANGDALYACVFTNLAGTVPAMTTVPAGWTQVGNPASNGAPNTQMYVYGKIAASEPASWTWGTAASSTWTVHVVAVSNPGDAVTPTDYWGGTGAAGFSSAGLSVPSLVTTRDNALVVQFWGTRLNTGFLSTPGATKVQDQANALGTLATGWSPIPTTGIGGPWAGNTPSLGNMTAFGVAVKGPPVVLASPAGSGDPFFWSL